MIIKKNIQEKLVKFNLTLLEDLGLDLIIKNKYGICQITKHNLLHDKNSSIKSALNKNEYWINQAKEVHGNTYDYSLVEWKSAKTKILILCEDHNIFEQTPNKHLSKQGCPVCGKGCKTW